MKVYPNPASDFVMIQAEFEIEALQLYDISGRLVRFESGDKRTSIKVDRKSLKPGFYLLDLQTEQGEHRIKICFE